MEQQSPPWRVFDAPASGTPGPGGTTPERIGSTSPGQAGLPAARLVLLALAGAAAIGVVAVTIAMSGGSAGIADGPDMAIGLHASGDPAAIGGGIVVDVSGAVVSPGVYRLASGARVSDAIDAAGGLSPRVDVDRLAAEINLAAPVSDGAQLRIPSRDDPRPAAGGGGPGAGSGHEGDLVHLNTATAAELEALPGIGPVTAAKILESRSGAKFTTVDDLRERGLVGQKTFDKIRALLTVD